jgi:arylsulfatase A-like enzyme
MTTIARRRFVGLCGAAAVAPWVGRGEAGAGRPNILFVFADQLRSMDVGCYGSRQVRTPNIDRLAREGMLFSNAISTAPVCSPFRAMLMTGNHPMKNGMVYNDHFLRNPTPCFAEACKAAGYRTGYIGKWHIDGAGRSARIPPERRLGFEFWRTLECTHAYFKSPYYHQDEDRPRTWEGYDAVAQTDAACGFLRDRDPARPFCLFLSWGPPHDPYVAPPEYMGRFDPAKVELRPNVDDFAAAERMRAECDTRLPDGFAPNRKRLVAQLNDRTNGAIRQWIRGYLAAIATLDDCMGRLLVALKETGDLDRTVVVFTSDHGDSLGSHRQYGKQMPYEESISIPFLVRYPAAVPAGTTTDALLAPVDMMPTVLALAGVPCPAVDGRNLADAARGRGADTRDAVLIQNTTWIGTNWIANGTGPWRGVRTKTHTYARRSDTRKPWMLFDNRADPYQVTNLVDRPEYAALVAKLDARTTGLLAEAGDPEDPVRIAKLIQDERRARGLDDRAAELLPARVEPGSGFRGATA